MVGVLVEVAVGTYVSTALWAVVAPWPGQTADDPTDACFRRTRAFELRDYITAGYDPHMLLPWAPKW